MILKKGFFSDIDDLKICGNVCREEYEQVSPARIETQNTENQSNTEYRIFVL